MESAQPQPEAPIDRHWVVVAPDGAPRVEAEQRQNGSVLDQLCRLIGGPDPVIDTASLTHSFREALEAAGVHWRAGHGPMPGLVAIVHDEGLLHPDLYPMQRSRMLAGFAGTVVIGTDEIEVDSGEGYMERDLGGLARADADFLQLLLGHCRRIPEAAAEAMREERLGQWEVTPLDRGPADAE